MGCCNSKDFITALEPKQTKMEIGGATEEKKAPSVEGVLKGSKIQLKVLIPEQTTGDQSGDETSPRSPSPTLVSQRSRSAKKSVTFNPISIVKEYPRNSSSSDKNVTTYICSQLGLDTLSETDSNCDHEGSAAGEQAYLGHDEQGYGWEHGDYEDWRRYQQALAAEQGIDRDHPSYLPGFDFDYEAAAEQRELDLREQERQEELEAEYEGLHAASYRDTSCVWLCA